LDVEDTLGIIRVRITLPKPYSKRLKNIHQGTKEDPLGESTKNRDKKSIDKGGWGGGELV
jgi:hypothetical protein